MPPKKTVRKKQKKVDIAASFYTDIEFDNMLYAVLVRSPVARGTIKSVTHPDMPQGYFLFTAKDITGTNRIRTLETETPILATDEISYQGEPVAILAGPDKRQLDKLISELDIRFTRSKTMQTAAGNTAEGQNAESGCPPESTETVPQNNQIVLASRTVHAESAAGKTKEELFEDAAYIVENTYTEQLRHMSCLEPNGCIAFFKSENLTICTPTNWIGHLKTTVSDALGISADKISIRKTISSESGTNSIWYNAILAAQAALAAQITGKPVKIELSRSEQIKYIENPLPVTIHHKTAADSSGRITVMEIAIAIDAGAYNPFIQEIADRLAISAAGIYAPETMHVEVTALQTPSPPAGAHLQWADSKAFFAVENQIQLLSERTGIHPLDIRKLNKAENYAAKQYLPFNFLLDNVDTVLDTAANEADFKRKYAAYHAVQTAGYAEGAHLTHLPRKGIGISCGFEGCIFFGSSTHTTNQMLEVTLEIDGSVSIRTYPPSPAVCEIWKKIVSSILHIDAQSIKIGFNEEQNGSLLHPEKLYNNISVMTQLLRRCCTTIQRQRFRSPLPITVKRVFNKNLKKKWDAQNFCGTPFHNTSCAAAVVELELNPDTYKEQLTGIWIAVDGGQILSPKNAEETIRRAVQQILEDFIEDCTPRMPPLHISFIQSSGDSKQIGELIFDILPAAFTQALSQASGCGIQSLPISTNTVYTLLQQKQKIVKESTENAALAGDK